MSRPPAQTIALDGLEVSLCRGKDGKLVVDIQTDGLADKDTFAFSGVPNIRIWINEQKLELNADGDLIETEEAP